jgi:hypothetical protein
MAGQSEVGDNRPAHRRSTLADEVYLRTPRLGEELRILHCNGGFTRWLAVCPRSR